MYKKVSKQVQISEDEDEDDDGDVDFTPSDDYSSQTNDIFSSEQDEVVVEEETFEEQQQEQPLEEEEENEIDDIVRLSNLLNERNKRTIEEDRIGRFMKC